MSATPAKKQKRSHEVGSGREFQEYWSERFGMIKKDNKALCILCSETVVCRTSSVKRHYETVHRHLSIKSEHEQKEYISQELSKRKVQLDTLVKLASSNSSLVAASFEVSKVIAKHGKPLSDGEYIKEAWLEAAPFLFDSFSEKEKIIQRIKDLPVSRNTVKDRILKLERHTAEQLTRDLTSCKFFSLCLDESTDNTTLARLAIFARFCRGDEVCEELINIMALPVCATRPEICKTVINELTDRHIDVSKIVSVTTDGTPNMIGAETDFVNVFEKHIGHSLLPFHCIIHEGALCAQVGLKELEDIMQTVTKVVHFISSCTLKMGQFQNLLNEVHSVYSGLLMHNSVHWLSQGSVLNRFVESLDKIRDFLNEQNFSCEEMSDIMWICKLMFFADFCSHFSDLNMKLQGCGKTLDVMFDTIKAFEVKLGVFKRDIGAGSFRYFPNLRKHIPGLETYEKEDQRLRMLCLNVIESTTEQFSSRFVRFRELEETAKFIKFADIAKLAKLKLDMFHWIDLDDFEMQLIEFQSSSIWRQKFIDLRAELENIERARLMSELAKKIAENEVLKVWNSLPDTFICLKNLALALLTIFSSTYACESLISVMNLTKSAHRSGLTDEASAACIALKVTKYKPDIQYLSSMIQQQKSH